MVADSTMADPKAADSTVADLKRLWAPWRSGFVNHTPRRGPCFFCAAKRSSKDRRHHVVARSRAAFAILNRYPYNNGHLLIAPYRHLGDLAGVTLAEWGDLLRLSQRLMRRLKQTLRPHGFNLGVNLGRASGAGVPGHLHLHIVPRWIGDTNFFPVLGRTKVLSQSLDELYALLAPRSR